MIQADSNTFAGEVIAVPVPTPRVVQSMLIGPGNAQANPIQPQTADPIVIPPIPLTTGSKPAGSAEPPAVMPGAPLAGPMSASHPVVANVPCETCPPAAPKPPATWHGYKLPVQPFAPPGAFPPPPTGPGYYTLLALVQGEEQQKPPRWPYPRGGPFPFSFAETNFSYLDAIPFNERDWAEKLKRIPLGDHFLFSTGGELRYRYNYETNSRGTGITDTYNLFRNRLWADMWYEDKFRIYGEYLYGESLGQDLPPYPRDVNLGAMQQLFADIKVFETDKGNPIYVRIGRQELLYGSQRLLSPNDWGDNRVRFQGVKGFYRSEKFDADLFLTQPVAPQRSRFDSVDNNIVFSGAWFQYRPKKGHFVDAYYLNLDNANRLVAQGQLRAGAFNINTVGGRYFGKNDGGFLWDLEGAVQFGSWADQSVLAQMYATYFGYNWKECFANPTLWVGYDYASGDPDPGKTGQRRTFNQLFAFGHYYLGFVDFVGRQNIHDFNVQGYVYPMNWITAGMQYHVFRLDSNKDALYPGAPGGLNSRQYPGALPRRDPTGRAGDDVGTEIDVLTNFHITDRQDVFITYSHFFPGAFFRATGPSVPADFLYMQYSMRW